MTLFISHAGCGTTTAGLFGLNLIHVGEKNYSLVINMQFFHYVHTVQCPAK